MRSAPTPLLSALAALVDQAARHDPGHVLVHLEEPVGPDVHLAVHPIGAQEHPFEVLAGFSAPARWTAFGIRATGRARHLDAPESGDTATAVTFLADRTGAEVSLLRLHGVLSAPAGPAEGTIPDVCRRVLGTPTPLAGCSPGVLWTHVWLDRVMATWSDPGRRRQLGSCWQEIASLHPAVGERATVDPRRWSSPTALVDAAATHAASRSWAELRRRPHLVPLPDGPVRDEVASWMDDGFFARWTLGAFPPALTLAADLCDLLGNPLGPAVLDVTAALLN